MTITPRPRLWILAALLSAGLSSCLSGCVATGAGVAKEPPYRVINGGTYVPVPTAETEYAKEAATLRLPAEHAWPQHPMVKSEAGTPEWYQIGYGKQAADKFWFCSWASVAVDASASQVRRAAVQTLQGMLKLYYYTDALDAPSRPQLVTELAAAQRGDLTAVRNDLRLNC